MILLKYDKMIMIVAAAVVIVVVAVVGFCVVFAECFNV